MSDFSFKKLFIAEEETTKTTTVVTPPNVTTVVVSSSLKSPGEETSFVSDFKKTLKDTLEDETQNNPGYVRLKKSIDALRSVIPDEKTRFMSAYIPLQISGLTKEQLIKSTELSLSVLEKETTKFSESLNNQQQTKIVLAQKDLATLSKDIEQKNIELKKLTDEISQLLNKKTEMELEIQNNQSKIETRKKDFDMAKNDVLTEIKEDIVKINTYI